MDDSAKTPEGANEEKGEFKAKVLESLGLRPEEKYRDAVRREILDVICVLVGVENPKDLPRVLKERLRDVAPRRKITAAQISGDEAE